MMAMTPAQSVARALQFLMFEKNYDAEELAKAARVSKNMVYRILSGDDNVGIREIMCMSMALGHRFSVEFVRPGFFDGLRLMAVGIFETLTGWEVRP
jgi:transcriptional regulator with XRE-family HTH domain